MAARPVPPAPGPTGRPRPTDDDTDALWEMERSLRRRGFAAIAGADEAGRGACAGPLVAAACVLPAGRRGRVPGLADSKLLSAAVREAVYAEVVDRALAWSVVAIPVGDLDARGMHVTNIEALRRAVRGLELAPDYVLTDGFPVSGLSQPSLAVWKGDRVAACVAAASVLAKVSRDRTKLELEQGGPDHARAARAVPAVRVRRAQGLHHRPAQRRVGGARALSGAPDALRERRPGAGRTRRARTSGADCDRHAR